MTVCTTKHKTFTLALYKTFTLILPSTKKSLLIPDRKHGASSGKKKKNLKSLNFSADRKLRGTFFILEVPVGWY